MCDRFALTILHNFWVKNTPINVFEWNHSFYMRVVRNSNVIVFVILQSLSLLFPLHSDFVHWFKIQHFTHFIQRVDYYYYCYRRTECKERKNHYFCMMFEWKEIEEEESTIFFDFWNCWMNLRYAHTDGIFYWTNLIS